MSFCPLSLRVWLCLAAAVTAAAAGCKPQDEIARYTVPKPERIDPTLTRGTPPAAEPIPQRTLGAIVLLDQQGWFFKLTGDPEAVGGQREAFIEFVEGLKFSDGPDVKPSWTLPTGWSQLPGNEFRFATIQIAVAKGQPLELSVSMLPKREEDQAYLLANINRWRSQVGLAAITAAELPKETEKLKAGEREATLVDVSGMSQLGGGMGGPFAGAPFAGGAAASSPPIAGPQPEAPSPEDAPLSFTAPPEWKPAPLKAFSVLTFALAEGSEADNYVSVSPVRGDPLPNVNRWRGQVGLPSWTEEELAKEASQIETLGVTGQYVEAVGAERTIFGIIAEVGGQQWIVKLQASTEIAQREKPRFEAFVKSLQLKS